MKLVVKCSNYSLIIRYLNQLMTYRERQQLTFQEKDGHLQSVSHGHMKSPLRAFFSLLTMQPNLKAALPRWLYHMPDFQNAEVDEVNSTFMQVPHWGLMPTSTCWSSSCCLACAEGERKPRKPRKTKESKRQLQFSNTDDKNTEKRKQYFSHLSSNCLYMLD